MQDFDLGESDLTQQIKLKQQRPWRVFLLHISKHMIPVRFVFKSGKILAVLPTQELLDLRDRAFDQIEHPQRATRSQ